MIQNDSNMMKKLRNDEMVICAKLNAPTMAAAEIAAYYSKAEGDNIAVDYLLARHVKKPAGSKPGFVIYHTNWTAYVTPNADKIAALRKK